MDTSSLNVSLLRKQIGLVRHSLQRARQLAALDEAQFLSSEDNFLIADSLLRRALEAMLDAGRHVVAKMGLGHADQYADIPRILGDRSIIPASVAEKAAGLARLRTRLVHLYWQVTPAEMHSLLRTRLDDLAAFCDALLRLAETAESRPRRNRKG